MSTPTEPSRTRAGVEHGVDRPEYPGLDPGLDHPAHGAHVPLAHGTALCNRALVSQPDGLSLERHRRRAVLDLVEDERVQHRRELLARLVQPLQQQIQLREPALHVRLMQHGEDALLGPEVVHDRTLRHPELGRDGTEVGPVVTRLGDVPGERLEDLVVAPRAARHTAPPIVHPRLRAQPILS
jgi:hypothetical protein